MARLLVIVLATAALLAACGQSSNNASSQVPGLQKQADMYAIEQIEVNWHKASSTKDVDLMMSLWADNAAFQVGTQTLIGKQQIRDFFVNKAAPFRPQNTWVSDTPAYKIRVTVDGDRGTLYFECHYVDVATRQVKSVVGADLQVGRINGRWVITSSISATPVLAP
jgi:ketosteroid isomerase-like protein